MLAGDEAIRNKLNSLNRAHGDRQHDDQASEQHGTHAIIA